jgi:hypothetical protein
MCVVSLPTFAPCPLRDAWGLVENRPALLRVVAPSALLRAAGLPLANHGDRTRPARGPGVLERPRGSAYAGGSRTHVTRVVAHRPAADCPNEGVLGCSTVRWFGNSGTAELPNRRTTEP